MAGTKAKQHKGCYNECMKEIILSNTGNRALVDDEDYDKVIAFGKWYENDAGYAVKKTRIKGKNVSIRMHVLINNTPRHKGYHTDHINGNRLDNRKSNLRTASAQLNAWNKKVGTRHSVYELPKGMSYDKSRNQYVATLVVRKRFNTKEEAQQFIDKGIDEL